MVINKLKYLFCIALISLVCSCQSGTYKVEYELEDVRKVAMSSDSTVHEITAALNSLYNLGYSFLDRRIATSGGSGVYEYLLYSKIQKKGLYPGFDGKEYYVSSVPTDISLDEEMVEWFSNFTGKKTN